MQFYVYCDTIDITVVPGTGILISNITARNIDLLNTPRTH